MTNIETIRKAYFKANPSLVEELLPHVYHARQCSLADVLLAISKSKDGRLIGMEVGYGNFLQYRADEIGEIEDWCYVWDINGARVKWNYLKHLEDQSEETLQFLSDLLATPSGGTE